MSDIRALVDEARALGAHFVVTGEKVKVGAPVPLPSELVTKLRQHKTELVEYLNLDHEPWMLKEWRKLSIPEWRQILEESKQSNESRRADYARWMLREILLDPEYEEPA